MTNKLLREINAIQQLTFDYISKLQTLYGHSEIYMTFFPSLYTNEDIEFQRSLKDGISPRMFTVLYVNESEKNENKVEIIKSMSGRIYMGYDQFYQLMIECGMDYARIYECMKFHVRHELGHIISTDKKFRGKTIDEWNSYADIHLDEYKKFPKLRINASIESRCKWYVKYNFELSCEREANEAVGITEQDVIDCCKRMCCVL